MRAPQSRTSAPPARAAALPDEQAADAVDYADGRNRQSGIDQKWPKQQHAALLSDHEDGGDHQPATDFRPGERVLERWRVAAFGCGKGKAGDEGETEKDDQPDHKPDTRLPAEPRHEDKEKTAADG